MYNTILGDTRQEIIPVSKEMEGCIMMFPSTMMHCVYPYYTTTERRISIAGNLLFNTGNSK